MTLTSLQPEIDRLLHLAMGTQNDPIEHAAVALSFSFALSDRDLATDTRLSIRNLSPHDQSRVRHHAMVAHFSCAALTTVRILPPEAFRPLLKWLRLALDHFAQYSPTYVDTQPHTEKERTDRAYRVTMALSRLEPIVRHVEKEEPTFRGVMYSFGTAATGTADLEALAKYNTENSPDSLPEQIDWMASRIATGLREGLATAITQDLIARLTQSAEVAHGVSKWLLRAGPSSRS